jgi:hypothetical protein
MVRPWSDFTIIRTYTASSLLEVLHPTVPEGSTPRDNSRFGRGRHIREFCVITRIWHGATPAAKSDEYRNLMRTSPYRTTARLLATRALMRYGVSRAIPHIF